jgi:hypothetical protein
MSILVPLAVLAAIAGLWWRVRQSARRDPLRLGPPQRPLHLPPRETSADGRPAEKHVDGQVGFLQDLKYRERETAGRAQGPPTRPTARRDSVIDAEFREVTERDTRA